MSRTRTDHLPVLLGLFGGTPQDRLALDGFETAVALIASRHEVAPVMLSGAALTRSALAGPEGLFGRAAGYVVASALPGGEPEARLLEVLDLQPAGSLDGRPVLLAGSGAQPSDLFGLDVVLRARLERLGAEVMPRSAFVLPEPTAAGGRQPDRLSFRQEQQLARVTDQLRRRLPARAYPEAFIMSW
jgi:hypothetical protein